VTFKLSDVEYMKSYPSIGRFTVKKSDRQKYMIQELLELDPFLV